MHHLEISLLIILLIDTQSYNKMLLLCVCIHVLMSFGIVVNQLKSLLLKQCREIPTALSPSKKQPSSKVEYAAKHSNTIGTRKAYYIIIFEARIINKCVKSFWLLHDINILLAILLCLNFDCHWSFLCTTGGKVQFDGFSGFGPNDS